MEWLDCIVAWGRNCIAEVQLYCNTLLCIVTGSGVEVRLYCDTARPARSWALRHGAGRCDMARRTRSRALRHGAGRAAWACCWAVGCAPCAFSLFLTRFDSVLFLSQFLDIVREPGS